MISIIIIIIIIIIRSHFGSRLGTGPRLSAAASREEAFLRSDSGGHLCFLLASRVAAVMATEMSA
eukprot:7671419-Pyramimonas_sp.AAC.1